MSTRWLTTLVIVRDEPNQRILLGLKKRGFGSGKWNGFGGKVKDGEGIEEAAIRELKEECSLTCSQMKKVGIFTFEFVDDPLVIEMHVFLTDDYEGHVQESDEMKPQWFPLHQIPYDQMWPDDIIWYPLILKGVSVCGHFTFQNSDKLVAYKMHQMSSDCLKFFPVKFK